MKRALCFTLLALGFPLLSMADYRLQITDSGFVNLQSTIRNPQSVHLVVVVQNSGAHRANALAIISLLERLVATKPEADEWAVMGFAEKFEQLSAARYRRSPMVLQALTEDRDRLKEAVTGLVFQGPSPIYDTVSEALHSGKPGVLLLLSNGVDNASETGFQELLKQVGQAGTRVLSLYFPTEAPGGGDGRLRKLAKASGGKFIDIRAKDSWDQLQEALR